MNRTLLALVLACAAAAGCKDDDSTTTAEPQQAEDYVSLAVGYGDEYDGLICDAYSEGEAFCADEVTFVYCSGGEWWELDCVYDVGADFCGEHDSDNTVDCYIWI